MPIGYDAFGLGEWGVTAATSASTVWPQRVANVPQTTDALWPQWVTTTTATTNPWYVAEQQITGISANVWNQWQVAEYERMRAAARVDQGLYSYDSVTTSQINSANAYQEPPPETDEERAAREARRRRTILITSNRNRARQLREKIAGRRAEALLLEYLDERQATEWREGHYFHVETADGRRRYRIENGTAGNVRLVHCTEDPLPEGARNRGWIREGARFCYHVYHPDGRIPTQDNVLAQLLLLETDEEQFLDGANVS